VDAELRRAVLAPALALACDADPPTTPRAVAIPDVEFCAEAHEWSAADVAAENDLVGAIEDARDRGGSCGALGGAEPAPAPTPSGALACAARVHAKDMATRDYFEHEDPDGRLAWHRIADAGYGTVLATELIAHGELDATELVDDLWLRSDPHCGALLAAEWVDVGVGRYSIDEPPPDPDTPAPTWWVVVLAVPDTP
jgi:hypothetical protein